MGIACARIGCSRKKAYGLFCVEHKPVPQNPVWVVCAARGCNLSRDGRTLFCGSHQRAMDRHGYGYLSFPPDLRPAPAIKAEPKPVKKATVKWVSNKFVQFYRAEHPDYWDGYGPSPGAALRDMGLVADVPF